MIAKTNVQYIYNYFKTDHLGNVRVLLGANGGRMTVLQVNEYYAFGLSFAYNNLHVNKFLYNGKEFFDDVCGSYPGYYDFGSRTYNPFLGRWFQTDPQNQFINPYLYCGNNPVMTVDPDGEWIFLVAAIIGAYLGGSAANKNFNPLKWDYKSWSTWGGIVGGAIQGMASVVGIQAGFAQLGWSGAATFGRSAGAAKFLTGTIKTANFANGWAKAGLGISKSLIVTNAAMKGLNTVATMTSAIANPQNAGQIIKGNFYYNPRRTFLGQVWEGISRGTYEGIQQSLGSSIGHVRNTIGQVSNVELFDGVTLVNYRSTGNSRWGMTLGNMINSQNLEASTDDAMFMHEYGHTQQSKLLGPVYPFLIGVPSLISATGSRESHSRRWYEMSANRYAERYFGRFHGVNWHIIQESNPSGNGGTYYPTH